MAMEPIRDSILFAFEDTVRQGMFDEVSSGGIILGKNSDSTTGSPRWAKVLAVGPDVDTNDIKIGGTVLIENLAWTEGFEHDGVKIWKTDVTKIMAIKEA